MARDLNDVLREEGPGAIKARLDEAVLKRLGSNGHDRGEEIKTRIENINPQSSVSKGDSKEHSEHEEQKRSQAEILIECAASVELFHGDDEEAYARLQVDGHFENHRIGGRAFRRWLEHQFWRMTEKSPSTNAMAQAISNLELRAFYEGEKYFVHLRIAEGNGCIYIDLCDDKWRAVEVTANGWRIVDAPPVRFIRTKGMLPLPDPVRGGSILDLREFVNLKSKDDFVLLVAWLLGAFRAQGPYPILALYGEQGTAKTTTGILLRSLVDPSRAPLRTLPREERDLFIAARNGRVLAFDNVSHIPDWLSDAMCRLSTGGGFSTRSLYTNSEEEIIDATRPILLTAIEECISRGDLADRALPVELARISDEERKPLADVMAKFEAARPKFFGSLCDALAHGLRELPNVRLNSLPRMADFARWAVACELALWQERRFQNAYSMSRDDNNQSLIDADIVATAVREWMASRQSPFEDPASQLLSALNTFALPEVKKERKWPKTAKDLSGRLKRASPALRKAGIEVEHDTRGRGAEKERVIRLVPRFKGKEQ